MLRWADDNVERGMRGSGAVQVHGFTDPLTLRSAVRGAEQFFVNDRMTWLARTTGEELPVCAFDAADLPDPIGFLIWSDDPSAHTKTLGRPRAVLWCRAGMTLRILVLDDAGPYRRTLEELGNQAAPTWASQIQDSLAGGLAIGFGATIPLNTETEWDQVKHAWTVDKYGRPAKDRYGVGTDQVNDINEDQLRVIRTLLGTLLLIRQPPTPAAPCGKPNRYGPTPLPENACAGPAPSTPMLRSATSLSASPSGPPPTTTTEHKTPPAASTVTSGSCALTAVPTPTRTTRRATPASGSGRT
ncbi:hypothetical protein [Streptomyces umbrinus]|uniref:hypothetical protein n=1 Tax=Streptomyces umbrinus TaxID=67370 RepID=UPI003446F59D